MDELLDKVREQFESGAPSKCMLESILGRIERKHRDALEDAWRRGRAEGVAACVGVLERKHDDIMSKSRQHGYSQEHMEERAIAVAQLLDELRQEPPEPDEDPEDEDETIDRLRAEVDRLTRERDEAREAAGVARAAVTRIDTRCERIERERDEARAACAKAVREFYGCKDERDEARERAAAAERERDTLRALLERCERVLTPEAERRRVVGVQDDYCRPLIDLLTDITAAIHQAKEQP